MLHVFYCIFEFCWYIKDVITVRKMRGMESFKIGFGYIYYYRLVNYTFA